MNLRNPMQMIEKRYNKRGVSLKVLTKLLAALGILGTALMGTTAFAYEHRFVCYSNDLTPRLEIKGNFAIERDSMLGRGQVEIKHDVSASDQYADVAFYRGMWTSNRLNFYLRTQTGEQLAVVIIEDFFENNHRALRARHGVIQGEYGNSSLTCYNRSCSNCFHDPTPTDHCRDVCGCTSPFCGAW